MNLSITTGQQFARLVGHVHLSEQSARGQIDGFGGANDLALELASRELREVQVSGEARTNGGSSAFRNVYVHPNGIRLGEEKQLLRGAAVSGVHQRAGVHIAACDDAAEGRVNVLEGLKFFEAADVGLSGSYDGLFRCVVADCVVYFLLGDAVGLDEFLKAGRGNAREVGVGF